MFKTAAVLAVAAILLPVQAAQAQTDPESGLIHLNLSSRALSSALSFEAAPAAAAAQAARSAPMRGYFIRAHGGLWFGEGEGIALGAGASLLPFANKVHEVSGNISYLRVEGSNGFMFEGNYAYNIAVNNWSWTPYGLAGLNVTHFGGHESCDDFEDITGIDIDCGSTDTALQIGGGARRPWGDREMAVELVIPIRDYSGMIARFVILF